MPINRRCGCFFQKVSPLNRRASGLKRLHDAMERMNMSARTYDRILKVARTIADLEASDRVMQHHIMEAIAYRTLARSNYFNL